MTPTSTTAQPTILLVSDDVRLRRTLGGYLREAGFGSVKAVATAERALAAVRRATPAVVVVDTCLGGTSCYQLAEELPAEASVLLVTAEEGMGPAIQADMVRAAGVVAWPCTSGELESRVREILRDVRSKAPAGQSIARLSSYAWA